jgi:hypothetical protein
VRERAREEQEGDGRWEGGERVIEREKGWEEGEGDSGSEEVRGKRERDVEMGGESESETRQGAGRIILCD